MKVDEYKELMKLGIRLMKISKALNVKLEKLLIF